MGKSAKLTEDQYIKLCNDLNAEIENIYQNLKVLSDSYKALMAGDSEGPYWNGVLASKFYNKAKNNVRNGVIAYDEVTDAWNKLYGRYIGLCKKNYF